ncbi:MAG: hypothetical protein D6784_00190 [Chloroflexi bacterium]|nr:MAG: hypothetical protein D6784_00190 [Chloroflexota bacterium]
MPTPSPTPTPLPTPSPTPTPYPALLISELLYDGLTPTTEGDEFVEVCNPNPIPVDPTGYRVGDAATRGDREGMYFLPANAPLPPGGCLVIARDAGQFQARFGFAPDADFASLTRDSAWGRGQWSLANSGDEVVLLAPDDTMVDSAAFRNGSYTAVGVSPSATAPEPDSLQRVWPTDLNSMPDDFIRAAPNPAALTLVPAPPDPPPAPADLPLGMHAYWGHLHAHTTLSDGAGPPRYAFAAARAAGLHFYALTDHAWWLTDTEWQNLLVAADQADTPGQFIALAGVEWSHPSAGHINLFGIDSPVRHDDPRFDTLDRLYAWLAQNPAVVAQFNHPDRDYDGNFNEFAFDASAAASIVLQEIGNHAQDYVTYETAFVQSNLAGWRVAPTNNGDTHTASWGTDTPGRTGVVAAALTRSDILAALQARRVFSTEDDNLALALHTGEVWMGSELSAAGPLSLSVFFTDPDAEPLTLTLFDGALPLDSAAFSGPSGEWVVDVEARPGHFFWVRAVQGDGHRAWTAPLWIAGQPEPEPLQFSELLPAPGDWDWTGDGQTDQSDEWLELYNPLSRPVGLGGWRLVDSSGVTYQFPLGTVISPTGYLVLPHDETGISLNNSGDTLRLVHPNGMVVDTFAYTGAHYDETWCRLPDGRWSDSCGPSPGEPNWELPPPSPLQVNIFQAKRLAYGAWLRVKGVVTAPPGVFGERVMYIQDDSSGIRVYLPANHGLSFVPGDRVEVEGHLKTYYGEWEIDVDEAGDVSLLGPGDPLPPLPIATTNMLEPYEGLLVMLTGRAVRFSGRSVFWVDDGTDPAKVYLAPASGVKKPFIEREAPVTVVGIVSQHTAGNAPTREDYRLMPRFQTDLLLPQVSPPPGWPTMLPETGYQ